MNQKEPGIQCPIFLKQEPVIERLTHSINRATDVHDKAGYAHELQQEAEVLMSCPDYKRERADCRNCHFLATVRKKTAEVIIMAQKLA